MTTEGTLPDALQQHHESALALRESEERYRRLFELCPDAAFVHCGGVVVLINSAGARLLGAENPEQLVGRRVLDFVHPDYKEIVLERMAALRQGGSVALLEQKIVRLDGVEVDVEVTA